MVPRASSAVRRIVFLGTGTSEGVPRLSCVVKGDCAVCKSAMQPGSRNRRRNTSLLLQTASSKSILIDCGKFWWESALAVFPKLGLRRLDSLLLTHSHFDAVGGLDNLRDLTTSYGKVDGRWTKRLHPLDVHARPQDIDDVAHMFPWVAVDRPCVGRG